MATGLALVDALRPTATRVAEVYPHGIFRTLGGGPLPTKTSPAGLDARRRLLGRAGVTGPHLEAWSHDAVDALAAALVAGEIAGGTARAATCGHDDSAIWLPAPPAAAA